MSRLNTHTLTQFLKMATQISTSINIQATPQQVWNILTDFEKYPEWNPFVKKLTGEVAVGNQIEIALPGMNFKPTVLAFESAKEFRWIGKLFFKGVFDGEHFFKIAENGDGTTHLEHGENFSGFLVPIFKGKMLAETKKGFEEMNQALKKRAEKL